MVHDEKVTVPLLMRTPPPCKQKRKTCEFPIVGRSCAARVEASASANAQARIENRGKPVSNFPIGAIGSFQGPLRHVHTEDDRSVGHSCASENQNKRVSIFPIGAMGTFEHEHPHSRSLVGMHLAIDE